MWSFYLVPSAAGTSSSAEDHLCLSNAYLKMYFHWLQETKLVIANAKERLLEYVPKSWFITWKILTVIYFIQQHWDNLGGIIGIFAYF